MAFRLPGRRCPEPYAPAAPGWTATKLSIISAPGEIRTHDRRIRRVTDHADYAFYLLLCLQSIGLGLLELL